MTKITIASPDAKQWLSSALPYYLSANGWVQAHDLPFFNIEGAWFVQDGIRNTDFTDIV